MQAILGKPETKAKTEDRLAKQPEAHRNICAELFDFNGDLYYEYKKHRQELRAEGGERRLCGLAKAGHWAVGALGGRGLCACGRLEVSCAMVYRTRREAGRAWRAESWAARRDAQNEGCT